jgi:hypothetical protein
VTAWTLVSNSLLVLHAVQFLCHLIILTLNFLVFKKYLRIVNALCFVKCLWDVLKKVHTFVHLLPST